MTWFKFNPWTMGTCNGRVARRHRITREVQFVLWKKGDQQGMYVYSEDFWYGFDRYHWANFKPNK